MSVIQQLVAPLVDLVKKVAKTEPAVAVGVAVSALVLVQNLLTGQLDHVSLSDLIHVLGPLAGGVVARPLVTPSR